ncbi:hypothetical protein ERJ75_001745400 [Trypanosoma vivax]|uniref:Uncharacterized protein n=1 Tax=Trypanosoma vivax (strain Y486) TaxID=1055687 RepID=G0U2Q3_TRYVY|nr:hypothetical protein TRVL_05653 [Trypanosoma vivax]KAH8604189.1 hypothetical protein ERJ75_001745400 [Trypanosoma vivax]CCC50557.1 conserved hypothetical protein [Trypanosoma vivax Y486]
MNETGSKRGCDISSSAIMDELYRTKENLSEVIEECVFLERQCKSRERELETELVRRNYLVADLSCALTATMRYLALLEEHVFVSSLGSMSTAMRRFPVVEASRTAALRCVEKALDPHNDSLLEDVLAKTAVYNEGTPNGPGKPLEHGTGQLSVEDASSAIRHLGNVGDEPVRSVSGAATSHKTGKGKGAVVSEAVACLDDARALCRSMKLRAQEFQAHGGNVGKQGEHTKAKENVMGFQSIERAKETAATGLGNASFGVRNLVVRAGVEDVCQRFENNEETTDVVRRQLEDMTRKFHVLERITKREREQLQEELLRVRNVHMEERKECDLVLGRVTAELEELVTENARLRRWLKQGKSAQSVKCDRSYV